MIYCPKCGAETFGTDKPGVRVCRVKSMPANDGHGDPSSGCDWTGPRTASRFDSYTLAYERGQADGYLEGTKAKAPTPYVGDERLLGAWTRGVAGV
ncbi:MAG: hypothetical protein GY913_21750 [Proteobacteria bacterium]|nr:hypothetical protein [Pseudomonadota bacterium]